VSKNRQPESCFIQFIPAYLIAFAARAFGYQRRRHYWFSRPLAPALLRCALLLLAMTSGDDRVAATGTIVVFVGTWWEGTGSSPAFSAVAALQLSNVTTSLSAESAFSVLLYFAVYGDVELRNRVAARATAIARHNLRLLVFSYVTLDCATAWLGSLIVSGSR